MARRLQQPSLCNGHHHSNATPDRKPFNYSRSTSNDTDLARKASFHALTGHDDTESSFASSITSYSSRRDTMDPTDLEVGDVVEVPGGMTGTVRFLGAVRGKNGVFAGVELSRQYASRGKNDGDVEGTRYFSTSVPGAGIFLPAHRATKQSSPSSTADAYPSTPTNPSVNNFDNSRIKHGNSQTPPTPSISQFSKSVGPGSKPNFSRSVGPGGRAPSPQLKKPASRPSLPRPESPLKKGPSLQPSPQKATPGAGFSQSVRGGRPPGLSPSTKSSSFGSAKTPIRNQSRSTSRQSERSPDLDATPTGIARITNGARPSLGSQRPIASATNEDNSKLRRDLEDRDRQLKEQAASLAEMENSLAELQSMVAVNSKNPHHSSTSSAAASVSSEEMSSDVNTLRSQLRDRDDTLTRLTKEFDSHRQDFRSTIDTLEMASTETERVYEKRVEELLQEIQELNERPNDFEAVARQLKQLEEFVQELEEGLEAARRGEAEARSEIEFLHGEVERSRTELRREREKAAKALRGADAAVGDGNNGGTGTLSARDVAQRDDEIRGLKAIIHSLSSGPPETNSPRASKRGSSGTNDTAAAEVAQMRSNMDALAREKSELQGLIDRKKFREEELEREISNLRTAASAAPLAPPPLRPNSPNPPRKHADSATSTKTAFRPGTGSSGAADLSSFPHPPSASSFPLRDDNSGLLPATNGREYSNRPGTASSAGGAMSFHDASEDVPPSPARQSFTSQPKHQPSFSGQSRKEERKPEPPAPQPQTNMSGDGPAPGRSSRRIDMSKWCALCERDGHESVDCPFEEDF